jgi:hypothetical protein
MTLSSRSSLHLGIHEGERIRQAILFAYCRGWAFNRHVTVHFNKAHIQRPHAALVGFLKRAGDWVRKRSGMPPAYVWVLENPPADFGRGSLHAHILIHVPPALADAFDRLAPRWLLGPGRQPPEGAVRSDPLFYSHLGPTHPQYLEHGLLGVSRYLLKGLEPGGLPGGISLVPQGTIMGKRSGYSEALGEQHRWQIIRAPAWRGAWVADGPSRLRRWVGYVRPELAGRP